MEFVILTLKAGAACDGKGGRFVHNLNRTSFLTFSYLCVFWFLSVNGYDFSRGCCPCFGFRVQGVGEFWLGAGSRDLVGILGTFTDGIFCCSP